MEREQEGHRFERRDGDGPLWGGDCWPESWMGDDTRHVSMRGRGCPWGWNRDPGPVWNESQLGKEQQWERGQMGCQQIPAASSASSPSEPHRLRLPSFFHWHSFSSAVQTQKPSLMSREVISCSEVRFLMCEWHFSFFCDVFWSYRLVLLLLWVRTMSMVQIRKKFELVRIPFLLILFLPSARFLTADFILDAFQSRLYPKRTFLGNKIYTVHILLAHCSTYWLTFYVTHNEPFTMSFPYWYTDKEDQ